MEFIILQSTKVTFPAALSGQNEPLVSRSSTSLKATIQAFKNKEDGTSNALFSRNLTTAIIENPWKLKSQSHCLDWNFTISIAMPNFSWNSAAGNPGPDGSSHFKIVPTAKVCSFLNILHDIFNVKTGCGESVTINVVLKEFVETGNGKPAVIWPSINLKPQGFEIGDGHFGNKISCNCVDNDDAVRDALLAWKQGREFSGIFTISLVFSNMALGFLYSMDLVPNERFKHLENLLKNEIGTDTEIVVGVAPNQTVIKCHRAFLLAGSEVFQKMFGSGLKEAKECRIEMEGISEKGVRALLAYLYHRDVKAVFENSDIVLELLEAAEKYDIEGLRDIVRNILLARESSWFEVDIAFSLYIFAKNLCSEEDIYDDDLQIIDEDESDFDDEDASWDDVKIKALRVLKWYSQKRPKTFLDSAKYKEIFSGDPKLGMEICAAILRLK